jgi:chlorobactene glucosyltransferase
VVIFTDADVRWQPGALSAVVNLMKRHKADMLTVWPTQETQTWSERLVVPLMSLAIISYLPEIMVRLSPLVVFAAANGQCLAFRRNAYEKSGGHAGVRRNITEDIALARAVKKSDGKLVMSDGNLLIGCRMYHNWAEVRDGFAKNILAGHGNSLLFLLVSTIFHWMVFVVPLVWLLLGGVVGLGPGWPWWPLGLATAGIGVRAISAAATRQRVLDALFMPASVWMMTRIAVHSAWWRITGGPRWKGRTISTQAKGVS